jgi:phosphoenolpyruvate-protein phosphotransferase
MSRELVGVGAAPGVVVAAPWVYQPASAAGTVHRTLDEAARAAAVELESLAERLRGAGSSNEAAILEAQALMARDEELLATARAAIGDGRDPVEAVREAGEAIATAFASLDDELLAARAADVLDVVGRIVRHLIGADAPRLVRRSVVVADDLAPSVTVELDRALLAGIVLEGGSRTSHAVILARALGIPAVVGAVGARDAAATADRLGIDGASGRVVVDPDAEAASELEAASRAAGEARLADAVAARGPLVTADGHRVACFANIGSPDDAAEAFAAGAEGIGLFRTEFAFAGRPTAPTEEEQAVAYEAVLQAAHDAEVVIRLVDIGGDKPLPSVPVAPEANPFLGVRAIRLAADHPDLFPTQVRAILRASARAGRPASIMAPMVADVADVDLVCRIVEDGRAAVPDAPAPRVGIMVEIPSAALLADQLATRVDFMSIGTNDLTQYLLAADRTNAALADRQDGLHPAVLRAVERTVLAARESSRRCEVAVCGELAGDPAGAMLLVGLGVDELSMGIGSFGAVKRAVADHSLDDLRALATRALSLPTADAVRELVAVSR